MGAKDKPQKFEDHLEALEKAVGALEGGQLGLEDSLTTYEEGVGALKRCHEILDKAEKKVQILLKGGSGEMEPQPFDVKKTAEKEKEEREERKKSKNEELGF